MWQGGGVLSMGQRSPGHRSSVLIVSSTSPALLKGTKSYQQILVPNSGEGISAVHLTNIHSFLYAHTEHRQKGKGGCRCHPMHLWGGFTPLWACYPVAQSHSQWHFCTTPGKAEEGATEGSCAAPLSYPPISSSVNGEWFGSGMTLILLPEQSLLRTYCSKSILHPLLLLMGPMKVIWHSQLPVRPMDIQVSPIVPNGWYHQLL